MPVLVAHLVLWEQCRKCTCGPLSSFSLSLNFWCWRFCNHCLFSFHWIQLKSLVPPSILVLIFIHIIKSLLKHLFWRLDSSSSLSHPFMTGASIPYYVCSLLLISSMSVFILSWGTQDWTQGSRCSVSAEQKHFPPPAGNAFPGAAQKAVELHCCLGCITDLAWTWCLPGLPGLSERKEKR